MDNIIDPEIMDDAKSEPLQVPDVVSNGISRALGFHRKAEASLRDWAENITLSGMELLDLKKACGHGNWLNFCQDHLSEISPRHIRNYLQVAEAVKARLGKKASPLMLEMNPEKFRKALNAETGATSWRQLLQDFGFGQAPAPQGRGGANAPGKEEADGTARAKSMTAVAQVTEGIATLRRLVLEEKKHNYLDATQRGVLKRALADVVEAL